MINEFGVNGVSRRYTMSDNGNVRHRSKQLDPFLGKQVVVRFTDNKVLSGLLEYGTSPAYPHAYRLVHEEGQFLATTFYKSNVKTIREKK